MQSFVDIIGCWRTVAEFATDVGALERTAMSWLQRKSIPAEWFKATAEAARQRAEAGEPNFAPITVELLAELAERRRLERRAA